MRRADGKELPEDLRQKTDLQLGVLTVMSVQKVVDSGTYACVANNKHGHSARRTTTVDVIGKVFRNGTGRIELETKKPKKKRERKS